MAREKERRQTRRTWMRKWAHTHTLSLSHTQTLTQTLTHPLSLCVVRTCLRAWLALPRTRCTTHWARTKASCPTSTWLTLARCDYRQRLTLADQRQGLLVAARSALSFALPLPLPHVCRFSSLVFFSCGKIGAKILVEPEPHANQTYNVIGEYHQGNQIVSASARVYFCWWGRGKGVALLLCCCCVVAACAH